jgi:hypothetical protein
MSTARQEEGQGLPGEQVENDLMELQIIKARTMFQLLDEFSVSGVPKQLLYLTNAQAREFNADNIDRLLATFEIPAPHIVITFPKTSCGFAQWNVAKACGETSMKICAFDEQLPGEQVFTQLVRFMKNVVIPMAAESKALVLLELSATCDTSSAFMQAITLTRDRFGHKLPFTVLGIDVAMRFHRGVVDKPASFTAKLADRSKWKRRLNFVEGYWQRLAAEAARAGKTPGEYIGFSGNAAKMGIPEGVNSLILVEGIECDSKGKPERVYKQLAQQISTLVLKHVTSSLPSIAFYPMGVPDMYKKSAGLDLIRLLEISVPVIMIDTRPRVAVEGASRRQRVECAVKQFKTQCNNMLAKNADFKTTGQLFAELHQNASLALLHNALTSDGAYGCSVVKNDKHGAKRVYLHEAITKAQEMRMVTQSNQQDDDLAMCCDALLSNYLIAAVMCECEDDASKHELLSQLTSLDVPLLTDAKFKPLVASSEALTGSNRSDVWMKFHAVLSSKQITSVHMDDLNSPAAKTRFQNIALADAEWLPSEQDESGLLMLRHAWTCADVLEHEALRYKSIAKFLNTFILALGVFITVITTIGSNGVISTELVQGALHQHRSRRVKWFTYCGPYRIPAHYLIPRRHKLHGCRYHRVHHVGGHVNLRWSQSVFRPERPVEGAANSHPKPALHYLEI